MYSSLRAPVRHIARAGAFVLMAAAAACDAAPGPEGPRVLELANDTIRLESGVSLIDVQVRRTTDGEFDPQHVEADTGDIVRFEAGDNGGHAIVFGGTALGTESVAFLEQSGQLRSPPLIASGSAWVITLAGAPAGEYPFRCNTHNASGRLTVSAR